MEADIYSGDKFYLCLVCGLNAICLLDSSQVQNLFDISSREQQWLRVKSTMSMWAWSKKLERDLAIPHNAFPNRNFST